MRKNSIAFCGGAFGDEGKGKLVDWYVNHFAQKYKVIVYRDNGGANAGHTVEVGKTRLALHQLPSGILTKNVTLILGKGMVVHPQDLMIEILDVEKAVGRKLTRKIILDEMATLSLDTHRAYESVLKQWQEGGKGSTGRGISPAYADILLRHPLRARDLSPFNTKKITEHYKMYAALIKGLGQNIAKVTVPVLDPTVGTAAVGSLDQFLTKVRQVSQQLKPMISPVYELLEKAWQDKEYAFVFEKAQAVGLDARWGVYPDITASDTTFDGIYGSTEGCIDPAEIMIKAGVIKATYMSSVGSRQLPSAMTGKLAKQIREDAQEYGTTTKRPRDILYLDLPALKFFRKVGKLTHLVLTHMDIVYDQPVKVCVGYTKNGKSVAYRPDQQFLNALKPVFRELKTWDKLALRSATKPDQLPAAAKRFIKFLETKLEVPVLVITTGPQRKEVLFLEKP
ncbi:MAG: hypothetical protein COY81_04225 [Candidatus Pacebacteria bacterium CG_4_10_14_0_8_um_filter_43_12]|nr:MAG: hypothetical protein COU66_00525 [Candidatus Pacebacteria bacterium CG10_big_fil_rev_8_21_14_0_10_44_11]PIY79093.1 MAG: hypothetical protein COY81_04225 [Candidatus Pacebacteria bacterium CG_4_10_14_0_8_um_filter_43_12]